MPIKSKALAVLALCAAVLSGSELRAQSKVCSDHDTFVYQLSYIESSAVQGLLTTLGYTVIATNGTLDCSQDLLVVTLPDPSNTGLVASSSLGKNTEANPQQRLLILWKKRPLLTKLLDLLHQQIDVPAKQILIEALVLELDRDRFRDLGVDYTASKDGGNLTFNQNNAGALVLGVQRPFAKTVLDFTASLSALVDEGAAEVLSRPSVLVLDGRPAKINVGDKLPYTKLTRSTLDIEGQVVSDTVYIPIGIELSLRPRASDDNSEVSMQVVTKVDSPSGTSTINPDGSVVPPPIATREVASHVRVANNTPFIIAGLIRSTLNDRRAGVPLLSKIPGLGHLFRRTTKNLTEKEVIVVITPHVIPADEPMFAYNVAKDSSLLDQDDLDLFRNIYRLRNRDIYDSEFVTGSAFIEDLKRQVVETAAWISERYSQEFALPPVPSGDRVALAARMRELVRLSRNRENLAAGKPVACSTFDGELPVHCLITGDFVSVLDGVIPGEDVLVKRMLLGIVQRWRFGRLVDVDKIRYFRKPYFLKAGALCPAPAEAVPLVDDTKQGAKAILGANQPLLDFKTLPTLDTLGDQCETLVVCLETETTSAELSLDAPMATLSFERIPNESYMERLVALNAPPSRSALLLNNCAADGRTTSLDHLKDILVLKRFLQLNAELPLRLDAFHVGREITFPVEENLKERVHVVDLQTARLFYETLDYYGAFSRALANAHGALEETFKLTRGSTQAVIDQRLDPAPAERPAATGFARPEVRIVVWRGDEVAPSTEPPVVLAAARRSPGLPAARVQIQIDRPAVGSASLPR